MRSLALVILLGLVTAAHASGQDADYQARVQRQNVPSRLLAHFDSAGGAAAYEPSFELNPFYLRGDFNGDGAADIAMLVEERSSGRKGIAIFHAGAAAPVVLGAGHDFGNGGDDFSWLGIWKVFPADYVTAELPYEMPDDARAPDGLYVEKPESASALIYWNGRAYVWLQMGD